jgi:hypothetical protein
MSAVDQTLLVTVLDRLLPPNGDLAGAGGLGLAAQVPATAAAPILDALPDDFLALDAAGQVAALQAVEAANRLGFHELVRFAYVAYYRDSRVLARIELATGYPDRPPQPLGYEMEPFDESLLDVVKSRGPQYRDTREIS